jgi:hypothetical protein
MSSPLWSPDCHYGVISKCTRAARLRFQRDELSRLHVSRLKHMTAINESGPDERGRFNSEGYAIPPGVRHDNFMTIVTDSAA